jgi:hypothetical protein
MAVLIGSMLLLMIASQARPEERPVAPNVSIEARYVADPEPAILFQLRAREDHVVYESDLPWGNFYSVRLTFRDRAGKSVCPLLAQPIDDPSSIHVLLRDQWDKRAREATRYCRSLSALAQASPSTGSTFGGAKGSGRPLQADQLPGSK